MTTGASQETTLTAVRRVAFGGIDPTTRVGEGALWRATHTIDGPGLVRIPLSGRRSELMAWGPGADLLRASAPGLLGELDDPRPLEAPDGAVRDSCRRHWHVPLTRSNDPYHELIPAILGQRVTVREASLQWVRLCRDLGTSAPGPDGSLLLPPDPERLSSMAYHELHRYGIERSRAQTIIAVARRFDALALGSTSDWPSETGALTRIRGVGPWTAAVAGGAAYGDPDAVPVGDFHLKNTVVFALTGAPRGTDDEMLGLLEPYRGQRARVLWWLGLDGWRAPRRGPGRRNLSVANL